MKRYLCTTCQRIVRVRRLPDDAELNLASHEPNAHTVGTCRHHGSSDSRARINDRGRVRLSLGSTRKMSASAAKSKSKG